MIDIVFPLGGGSHWQDNEIRYSLRSIDKHVTGVRNIVLVGKCPSFLKNVIHLPFEDEHPCKETNIYRKVLRACEEESVTDDFLFFNDDHFILKDFVANELPFFQKGNLSLIIQKLGHSNKYRKCLLRTWLTLKELQLNTNNFDTHTPIIYNKLKFKEIMSNYDWTNRWGFVIKSLYTNSLKIDGVYEPDCKINGQLDFEQFKNVIKDRIVFSVGNGALGETLYKILNELYPNPSRWEV